MAIYREKKKEKELNGKKPELNIDDAMGILYTANNIAELWNRLRREGLKKGHCCLKIT